MKLNPDCIRDILLSIEDSADFMNCFEYRIDEAEGIPNRLAKYSHDEIIYHIRQCSMSNLITTPSYYDGGDCICIQDLTPSGHQFIANIRSDTVWNNTKTLASKIGSYSLDVLTNIAVGVLTQMINKQLGY